MEGQWHLGGPTSDGYKHGEKVYEKCIVVLIPYPDTQETESIWEINDISLLESKRVFVHYFPDNFSKPEIYTDCFVSLSEYNGHLHFGWWKNLFFKITPDEYYKEMNGKTGKIKSENEDQEAEQETEDKNDENDEDNEEKK